MMGQVSLHKGNRLEFSTAADELTMDEAAVDLCRALGHDAPLDQAMAKSTGQKRRGHRYSKYQTRRTTRTS
jgi:hypothetical protein